ncbi:MAG: hypothetical protein ABH827_05530 [bacterium]
MENIFFIKSRSFFLALVFVSVGYQLSAGPDGVVKASPVTVAASKKIASVITAANKPGMSSVKTSEKNIDKIFEETMALIEQDDKDQVSNQEAKLRTLKEKLLEAKIKELEKRNPASDGVGKTAWKSIKSAITDSLKFLAGEPLKYAFLSSVAFVLVCRANNINVKDAVKYILDFFKPSRSSDEQKESYCRANCDPADCKIYDFCNVKSKN